MLYREDPADTFTPWTGEPLPTIIDGKVEYILHPSNIEGLWTSEELAAIGLYVPAHDPVPAGKQITLSVVQRVGGVVKFVDTYEDLPPPDNYKPMIRRRADKLMRAGDVAGALLTLKTIGE